MPALGSSMQAWGLQAFAEFLGTAMFLYLAVGGADAVTHTNSITAGVNNLAVAMSFGISLVITTWAFFRISGAHFNPAITVSSMMTGHTGLVKGGLYVFAQLLGAMAGIGMTKGTAPQQLNINVVNRLSHGESMARGFFLEFWLTTIMVFVYHMTTHEKNRSTWIAALPIGLTAFSCYLFGTSYTGTSINPARAFGASVVAGDFPVEHWIFWFGPLSGAVLGAALHMLFRWANYDHLNPGQDADSPLQYQKAVAAHYHENPTVGGPPVVCYDNHIDGVGPTQVNVINGYGNSSVNNSTYN